jgi:hypothetical protein
MHDCSAPKTKYVLITYVRVKSEFRAHIMMFHDVFTRDYKLVLYIIEFHIEL